MSRRNTIIVAVLLNAAVLVVLFVTAVKTDSKDESLASTTIAANEKISEVTPAKDEIKVASGDEVDLVLHQLANPAQPSAMDPSFSTQLSAPGGSNESIASFVEELKAISTPTDPISTAPERETTGFVEVKVKKGDFLAKIAKAHHTTVEEIMRLNHLKTSNLRIGQTLKVKHAAKGAQTTLVKSDGAVRYYTIKNGDNPWTIAVKNHMKVEELLKLNNLDAEKARHLKPGDQIKIR